MFQNANDVKTYALAGHSTLTLTSQRTGARYTYKVSKAKGDRLPPPGASSELWFVGLLSGPDNESDYTYVGMINGTFKTTAKSRFKDDAVPVRAFRYFWQHVDAGRLPPEVEIRHCGRCGRCGRTLTVPESIDRGIGPECASKMGV
jgi:hypothetical protein